MQGLKEDGVGACREAKDSSDGKEAVRKSSECVSLFCVFRRVLEKSEVKDVEEISGSRSPMPRGRRRCYLYFDNDANFCRRQKESARTAVGIKNRNRNRTRTPRSNTVDHTSPSFDIVSEETTKKSRQPPPGMARYGVMAGRSRSLGRLQSGRLVKAENRIRHGVEFFCLVI